jgi:hypothetical protein
MTLIAADVSGVGSLYYLIPYYIFTMKHLALITVLFFFFSCEPSYMKVEDKLEGSWKLADFSYTDSSGKSVSKSPSSIEITFLGTDTRKGVSKAPSGEFAFAYSFGPDRCNLDFTDKRALPLEMIGKVQVYTYTLDGRNTLRFSIENEYDYVNSQVLRDVSYTFVRK